MKKLLLPLLLLALLAGGTAWVLLHHAAATRLLPGELLPPETIAYAELPDLRRSRERWMHTALRELWQEPELQGFLERPRAKYPPLGEAAKFLAKLEQVQPRAAFAALLSLENNQPKTVAGLQFSGSRQALEALLAEPRAALHRLYPAGRSELLTEGTAEIQTFTAGELTVAECVQDAWYFVANDLPSLRAMLLRARRSAGGKKGSLAEDETFRKTLAPLPSDAETVGFLRLGPVIEKFVALAAASGQVQDPETLAALRKRQAAGYATRIEGAGFRDSLFLYAPGSPPEEKLPLGGLALTTPETLFFYDSALNPGALSQVLTLSAMAGVSPARLSPLVHNLGTEFSLLLDWPATAEVDAIAAVRRASESATLQAELEKLADLAPRSEQSGHLLYTFPGLSLLQPVVTATDHFLLLGLNAGAAVRAAERKGVRTLADSPDYQSATKQLPPVTGTFAYLNTGAFLDRLYGTARPALALALAVNPATTPFLDASRLPSAPVLAKHFGPTTLFRTSLPEGQLIVSQGNFTFTQMLAVFAGGGAAAFPAMRDSLPPGLLPGGFSPPPGPAPETAPPAPR